jgi:molybdopterin-containing oxidoreductase family membrane subunit
MLEKALKGNKGYWSWMGVLAAFVVAGFVCYLWQLRVGLATTGMGRDVSWGLYIANFTFLVGVAASAVTVVLPYYLHDVKAFGKVTVLGEFLAVSAVVMSVLFIFVDLGQPGRVLNIILYPSPTSLLFWDMIVLTGYLLLNLITGWSTLDAEYKEEQPVRWARPLIILAIPWAISIHTVTAFIYAGLNARPFWLTALLAPRFLASAFASGPALLIIAALVIRRCAGFDVGKEAIRKVATIVTYALAVMLFFFLVELFTVFYSGLPEHTAHFRYLLFGSSGSHALVVWAWAWIILAVGAFVMLLAARGNDRALVVSCTAVFIAMWIDKGLGLIVPGFVPSPLGEIAAYVPTIPETLITLGVWAFGFLIMSALFRMTVAVKLSAHRAGLPGKE